MDINKAINIMQLSNSFNFNELTKQYKKLLFKFHPDHGGSDDQFIELKNAYKLLASKQTYKGKKFDFGSKTIKDVEKNYSEQLIQKLTEILDIYHANEEINISVDIVGEWIWIGGDTKEVKDKLKDLNCRFSKNKVMWYWHEGKYQGYKGRTIPYNEIVATHGKIEIKEDKRKQVTA